MPPPSNTSTSSAGVATAIGTGTTSGRSAGGRETFGTEELAIVMSHFDIGIIDSIAEYPKGSRKAPKPRCGSRT